ncbi:hypothetical protein [Stenotrophobium rhamnosiphilum]|uniref:Uncharacterized protein n=1 Tax=Stenotrophobium rhamnosiphilum TaxID=2029166 RepID=A0A2T5MJS6_9GAMM|nr:hypothetical protein [Stenotrophobium rhamnosiphilum]PTU32830.1 hypothetical protein CJD38_01580 [Stenotrophobium rhamnosiphilum]
MFKSSSKEGTTYSLACIGLEGHVEVSLKSLLGILKNKTSGSWQHSEDINSDVIVYNPASPLAMAMLRRESKPRANGRSAHIFIPCSSEDPGADGLTLPLRADRLLHCLQVATVQLSAAMSTIGATKHASLCERLDGLMQTRDLIAVSITVGNKTGLINPARQMIHWPRSLDADGIAQLIMEDVTLQPLLAADLDKLRHMEQEMHERMPWDAVMWAIGVSTSQARLLPRLDLRKSYKLKRWPDFGPIGRRSSDIKCTALLTHKSLTPPELAAATGMSEARISGFLNACALCGFLEEAQPVSRANPANIHMNSEASIAGGMLQRIRKALALGAN